MISLLMLILSFWPSFWLHLEELSFNWLSTLSQSILLIVTSLKYFYSILDIFPTVPLLPDGNPPLLLFLFVLTRRRQVEGDTPLYRRSPGLVLCVVLHVPGEVWSPSPALSQLQHTTEECGGRPVSCQTPLTPHSRPRSLDMIFSTETTTTGLS